MSRAARGWCAGALALGACGRAAPATFELALRQHPEDGLAPLVIDWEIDALRLRACAEEEHGAVVGFRASARPRRLVPVGGAQAGSFSDGRDLGFDVPAGPWCALDVVPAGPLRWVGAVGDASVDLSLEVPPFQFVLDGWASPRPVGARGGFTVPDGVIEVGGPAWLSGALPSSGEVVVVAGDEVHDALVDALFDGSAFIGVYEAADADVALRDAERDAGAVAVAVPIP